MRSRRGVPGRGAGRIIRIDMMNDRSLASRMQYVVLYIRIVLLVIYS